jgi:hypothetical protein
VTQPAAVDDAAIKAAWLAQQVMQEQQSQPLQHWLTYTLLHAQFQQQQKKLAGQLHAL